MKKLGFDLYEGRPEEVTNRDDNNLFCEVERNDAGAVVKFKSIVFGDGTNAIDSGRVAIVADALSVAFGDSEAGITVESTPEGVSAILLPKNTVLGDIQMTEDATVDCTTVVLIDGVYECYLIPEGTYTRLLG